MTERSTYRPPTHRIARVRMLTLLVLGIFEYIIYYRALIRTCVQQNCTDLLAVRFVIWRRSTSATERGWGKRYQTSLSKVQRDSCFRHFRYFGRTFRQNCAPKILRSGVCVFDLWRCFVWRACWQYWPTINGKCCWADWRRWNGERRKPP